MASLAPLPAPSTAMARECPSAGGGEGGRVRQEEVRKENYVGSEALPTSSKERRTLRA